MKNLLIIFMFTFLPFLTFAQEGVKVKGNTITTKEIAPVWPGCETSDKSSKDCLHDKLNLHIKENFKYPRDSQGKFIRGKSVISFSIDANGEVKDISAEGEYREINEEAIRIVKLFPKMKPGQRGGKPISVKYKMPFNF